MTEVSDALRPITVLRHGEQAFLAALDRTVAYSRRRAADARSILSVGADVPGPTAEPRDALVQDLPVVSVRPLADYAISGLS